MKIEKNAQLNMQPDLEQIKADSLQLEDVWGSGVSESGDEARAVYDAAFVRKLIESALVQMDYLRRHIAPEINRRIRRLEKDFLEKGGLRERMMQERLRHRSRQKSRRREDERP